MTLSQYTIYSHWGARAETPEDLAERFIQLIDKLSPLHPAFSEWTWVSREESQPLSSRIGAPFLRRSLRRSAATIGVSRSLVQAINTIGKTTSRSLSVATRAGALFQSCAANHAYITTGWRVAPDPSIVTYAVFKLAMLAMSDIYNVDWCSAYPDNIMDLWQRDQTYRMPWMCYIKPAWVLLITPPKTAIVEYQPNDALFMSAAAETLIIANPAHLAVARDIEAAIAPLNALRAKEDPTA